MAASYRSARDPRPDSTGARRRAVSIALTVAAHLLIALLLLTLAPPIVQRDKDQRTLSTFDVARESGSAPKAAAAKRTPAKVAAKAAAAPAKAAERPERAATPPPPPPTPANPLWGDRSLLAGGDIGAIRSSGEQGSSTAAAAGNGSGRNSGSTYGPGDGPGGSRLYNAEWYRRPSRAEIAGYMPAAGVPSGAWGEIACKTIPGNQVESCRQLGESPAGSGISRALRQAAWQFRVLPPRIDGRPVIGAWVRIHFDITDKGDGDDR